MASFITPGEAFSFHDQNPKLSKSTRTSNIEANIEEILQEQQKGLQKILQDYAKRKHAFGRLEAELFQLQGENHRLRVELSKCLPPEGSACGSGETGGTSELVSRPGRLLEGASSSGDIETLGGWDSVFPPKQPPLPMEEEFGSHLNKVMDFHDSLPGSIGEGPAYGESEVFRPYNDEPFEKRVPAPAPVAFASPVELAPLLPVVTSSVVEPRMSDSSSTRSRSKQSGQGRSANIQRESELLADLVSDRTKRHSKIADQAGNRPSEELQDASAMPGMTARAKTTHTLRTFTSSSLKGDGEKKEPRQAAKAVFADATAMKERLRDAICKPKYNVADFYKETGWAQAVARKPLFDNITLAVIALNAAWIMVDTDHNQADILLEAEPVFVVMENFFCAYFFGEWIVRFMSFKNKRDGLKDAWFVFDSTLVAMMVGETWVLNACVWLAGGGGGGNPIGNASILRLFRLLRLSRMARMARLLRAMPELMVLIKGMATATRSVFFTLCLLIGIIYVFGIAFVQLMKDTKPGEEYFPDVPSAMNSLLLQGTIPDQAQIVEDVGGEHWVFRACILFYILLASLTVMNMLVGVLCEVVTVVSTVEKESLLVNYVKTQLEHMLKTSGIDADADGMIAKKEFEALLENPRAAQALQEVGVDVIGLVDFTDFIFSDGRMLSFQDFMDTVLSLRGSNTATVKDVVDLRKFMVTEFEKVVSKFSTLGSLIAGSRDVEYDEHEGGARGEVMMISRNTMGNLRGN